MSIRRITRLLLLSALLAFPVSAQSYPRVRAYWQGQSLIVEWSGGDDLTCLYLAGGRYPDTLIENGCGPFGRVTLPIGGVDAAYAPQLRERIELRDHFGVMAETPIPPRLVILPIVVAP